MSRPLHRGVSGGRIYGGTHDLKDSPMKDRPEKDDESKIRTSTDQNYLSLKFPVQLLFQDNNSSMHGVTENGFSPDPFNMGNSRTRHKLVMLLVKLGLAMIVILAICVSFWWTVSISSSTRGNIYHNYRKLQQQLLTDLHDIGELSTSAAKLQDVEFCSRESENFVPCFNISENLALGYTDGSEYDRLCGQGSKQNCIMLPPMNYKVPLRWPTGRDVIWVSNVKITAQEVLSSGSLTKRMMMLEEEQISFRSASPTFEGIEDYSHQIAEMIGLRNESNFIQAGVRTILDINCGYGSFGAHLFSKQLLTMCIANYEASGSQVQLTLERGLPAMIGSFTSKQLPYPSLSFDMLHCARCGVDWDQKGMPSPCLLKIDISPENEIQVCLGFIESVPSACKYEVFGYVVFVDDNIEPGCEAFPTYPRTYDLVHAEGLLTLENDKQRRCKPVDLFIEIDRILRPEGWVIIRDTTPLIISARAITAPLKWDARVVEIEGNNEERLLICQKPFFKRQTS
ncbi:putative S-adenosyl-L-methionine-dependent methyltransferase [Dillenia turbinata]|uniref:Methyltransferase n=1 Tax=Dillenia turbinata TaxID=194707 RepID=A0AAN8ZGH1_9MAGN